MLQQVWTNENRNMTVCIDSYEDGVLRGRFYHAFQKMERFESLIQFLMRMEMALEDRKMPQSYTALRKFSDCCSGSEGAQSVGAVRRGAMATFDLQVLFRQNSSWQGVIVWRERKTEQPFRSVLELVRLMDSALQTKKEGVA